MALITGLVFLLILTLIGISSMSSSQLNNIIVSNNQAQMQALNRTEVLLNNAEREIETMISDATTMDFTSTGDHYYVYGTIDSSTEPWSFTSQGSGYLGQYIIEYAGKRSLPGSSNAWGAGIAGDSVYEFTIVAKHKLTNGARRLSESLYVTQTAP